MNVKSWGLLFLLTAPLLVQAEEAASPAPVPAPVIGIVDVDEIQLEALAAKALRVQLDKYRQDFQQQSASEESALRTTQQSIEQQRKALSPDALADKARSFDASVADYQRRDLARRRALEKSFNQAMGKVQQAMFDATRKVATAHGANIILPRGQVVLFDDKMNMTKEIIALMDKALPTVDFPPPQIETDSTQQGAPPPPAPPKKKN
jgi:Skp family chaperone for outer membrane proteins